MSESTPAPSVSIGKLILIPSLITLGVTILRLVGELQHWTPILFNRSAGGGGAAVGISWLPLIFGPYFAVIVGSLLGSIAAVVARRRPAPVSASGMPPA